MKTITVQAQIPPYTYQTPAKCMAEAREEVFSKLIYALPFKGRWQFREFISKTPEGVFVVCEAEIEE